MAVGGDEVDFQAAFACKVQGSGRGLSESFAQFKIEQCDFPGVFGGRQQTELERIGVGQRGETEQFGFETRTATRQPDQGGIDAVA
jgi:hypothetical protein